MTADRTFLGLRFEDASLHEAVTATLERAESRTPAAVHFCNAYTVALAESDEDLRTALMTHVNYVDGAPLAAVLRRFDGHKSPAVRGPAFMCEVLRAGQRLGLTHFLLGGTEELLSDLRKAIQESSPAAIVVGHLSPPFAPITEASLRAMSVAVLASEADICWVGLGTPKQDAVVGYLSSAADCQAIAVGAAFDFIAGHKRLAPALLQGTGLEWLFRLACEPKRLWRRYLFGNAKFGKQVLNYAAECRRG